MRKRTKTVPGWKPANCMVVTNTDVENYYRVDVPIQPARLSETIEDVEERMFFNPVKHVKEEYTVSGYTPHFGAINVEQATPYTQYLNNNDELVEIPTMVVVKQMFNVVPEFTAKFESHKYLASHDYNRWVRESWKEPVISLSAGFSLPNFLIEMKQTAELINSYSLRRLSERWHSLMGKNRNSSFRIKSMAGERLAMQYGVKPLLSDAKALFDVLKHWKDRADRFLSRAGLIQRSYRSPYIYTLENSGYSKEVEYSLPIFQLTGSSVRMRRWVELEFRAVVYYTYQAPEFNGFMARLAQLADSLGVNLDAQILWDALPYSFVVDWFVNVGDWLHANYSTDWNHVDIRVLGLGHSAKIKEISELAWLREDNEHPGYKSELQLALREVTFYERKAGVIPAIRPHNLDVRDGIRVDSIINGAALAIQRTRYPASRFKKKQKQVAHRRRNQQWLGGWRRRR